MISIHELIEKCHRLRLNAIADELGHKEWGKAEASFNDAFDHLLETQLANNQSQKTTRLRRQAKLRYPNFFITDIDYTLFPTLKSRKLEQLATCDWVRKKQNLLIIGCTGLGKTSLACAIAQSGIEQHFSVIFFRLSNLLIELIAAQNDGKLSLLIKKLNRVDVLILDDWGNALMEKDERHLFFELIESRDQKGSILITSQYPIDVWHDTFQDATLADSVLDRIVHNSHQIHLKGESIRKLVGLQGEEDAS